MSDKRHALARQLRYQVVAAMATPLLPDGYQVDIARLPALVEFLLGRGVGGLFVGGTTGEGILLAEPERRRLLVETVALVKGRVPVLAHVGSNDTRTTLALTRHAVSQGADAIVAITPYFYGISDASLLLYFEQVAQAAGDLPLLVYDIPQMAANGISPALIAQLAGRLPNLVGFKTSRADMQVIRQMVDAAPGDWLVLAGHEPILLGSLALGARGIVSGLATAVPEPFVALMQAYTAGDLSQARRWQRLINQLLACFGAEERIGGLKTILAERDTPVGPPVPPRRPASAGLWARMAPILQLFTDAG